MFLVRQVARVSAGKRWTSVRFGTTVELTRAPIPGVLSVDFRGYDLLPDGRIVSVSSSFDQALPGASGSEIRVVLNWFEELKRLAPPE